MSQLTFEDLSTAASPLTVAAGPRALEDDLLATLARERVAEPTLALARPLVVVVPSGSLREHLAARIVERLDAVAGVAIRTVHGLAVEILERCGRSRAAHATARLELLVRRGTSRSPRLRSLERHADGWRSVLGTARDLLDAGLEPAHLDAALEALGLASEDPTPRSARAARAAELVRLACGIDEVLAASDGGSTSHLMRSARECVEEDPTTALPFRALWIHGFADATGRVTDLLVACASRVPTRAWIDRPPDPSAEAGRAAPGIAFVERWTERMTAALGPPAAAPSTVSPPRVSLFRAAGAQAEAREVARRVRALLQDGVEPEAIGIVARDLASHRVALRTHLERLGVPFSTRRTKGLLDGPARRVLALAELLREREDCSAERWVDALARIGGADERADRGDPIPAELRLGLRALGVARLSDAPAASEAEVLGRGGPKLPLARPAPAVGEGKRRSRQRRPGAPLAVALAAATRLLERFSSWPERAALATHVHRLDGLLGGELGWSPDDEARVRIARLLEPDPLALPSTEELTRSEFCDWIAPRLVELAPPPLGGAGAGVRVLDAMEARAHTFGHLFLVGLNRDAFPRAVPEDPLLSDASRGALASVLPDVPIKSRGHDEERYLFAQLFASAPHVTVSWQVADDDGRPRVVSPLVERLVEPSVQPPVQPGGNDGSEAAPGERTALEEAVRQGLAHGLLEPRILASALAEAGVGEPAALARARTAGIAELDRRGARLGPWLGLVGAGASRAREGRLWITSLEALARCPWQAFLRKVLRVEPLADAVATLPAIDALLLGNTVHTTLEELAREILGDAPSDLAAALERGPVESRRPDPETWRRTLERVAEASVFAAYHAPLEGLVRALVQRAAPYVERALDILGDARIIGVELEGAVPLPLEGDGTVEIAFRVDRVDEIDGGVVLTDFKSGRPLATSKSKPRAGLEKALGEGTSLQASAYVEALRHEGARAARGRYLYVRPDLEDWAWESSIDRDDETSRERFLHSLHPIVRAWRQGAFFPRLVDAKLRKSPSVCSNCDVKEACLTTDSGARARLASWTEQVAGDPPSEGLERAVHDVWFLAREEE